MNTSDLIGRCSRCGIEVDIRSTDILPQFGTDKQLYFLPKIEYSIRANGCQHDVQFDGVIGL